MPKIQLDVVVSQRKNRTDGFINYGQKADLSFYQIPVIIIEGGKPGKHCLLMEPCMEMRQKGQKRL